MDTERQFRHLIEVREPMFGPGENQADVGSVLDFGNERVRVAEILTSQAAFVVREDGSGWKVGE